MHPNSSQISCCAENASHCCELYSKFNITNLVTSLKHYTVPSYRECVLLQKEMDYIAEEVRELLTTLQVWPLVRAPCNSSSPVHLVSLSGSDM